MHIKAKFFLLVATIFLLSACDYISPMVDLRKGSYFYGKGEYEKAIPYYEAAIAGLSKVDLDLYKGLEYETRHSYVLLLTDHARNGNPEYIPVARENTKLILDYLKHNNAAISTVGMTLLSLAYTYHQEAAYTEVEEHYYQLLETAYGTYLQAVEHLKAEQDWYNLTYAYYNLGETAEWYGDIDQAVEWLELTVELDKKYGFDEDLQEDQRYLTHLRQIQQEIHEEAAQVASDDVAVE